MGWDPEPGPAKEYGFQWTWDGKDMDYIRIDEEKPSTRLQFQQVPGRRRVPWQNIFWIASAIEVTCEAPEQHRERFSILLCRQPAASPCNACCPSGSASPHRRDIFRDKCDGSASPPDWLQRRLLAGLVLLTGLNLLGTLAQGEPSTLEGMINWGPLALTASLCAIPVIIEVMGPGAAAGANV
ncbi:hypothetical protein QBC44DRAFT_362546 [Cladorrhinum sp. PSN332]|nr:hypothetical protein QBC44DRAFT_362546 [Cladorrhinum sp. PSN332]